MTPKSPSPYMLNIVATMSMMIRNSSNIVETKHKIALDLLICLNFS